MAEEGEIPVNPIGLAAIYASPPQQQQLKRRREDVGDAEESAPSKRQAIAHDVIFRIVVPSKQIGKVIGQRGHRIQKVREDTKATIKIADAIIRHEERVIIISSRDIQDGVTDAEKALQKIADLILQEDDKSAEAATGHVAANAIKLLIAGSQAGSLIGMSGQNIEKLRNNSSAMITVFAPNQLPFCASACESDRVVQVSGEVAAVLKAVEEIGGLLRENPPKEVISISPAYNCTAFQPPQAHLNPAAAEYVTFEMVIPESLVGGLIGRSGANISRIRSESGAMVKVYGGKGQQKHRYIQFGGNAQQIETGVVHVASGIGQSRLLMRSFNSPNRIVDGERTLRVSLAKQRVDEYIYSQLTQQQGTQQSILQR